MEENPTRNTKWRGKKWIQIPLPTSRRKTPQETQPKASQ